MAVDSAVDRISAFNFCNPFDQNLPIPNSSISVGDRHHLWGLYANIAPTVTVLLHRALHDYRRFKA